MAWHVQIGRDFSEHRTVISPPTSDYISPASVDGAVDLVRQPTPQSPDAANCRFTAQGRTVLVIRPSLSFPAPGHVAFVPF